jgi:hypothetical protein
MNRRELVITLIVSLVLGIGLFAALYGPQVLTAKRSPGTVEPWPTQTAESLDAEPAVGTTTPSTASGTAAPATREPTEPSPTAVSTESPEVSPSPTPTIIPLEVGREKGEDLEDVLLLYDSTTMTSFDTNFCQIAEYYGLTCRRIALDETDLTDELLRDPLGDYFRLVGIDADNLLRTEPLLGADELAVLKSSIEAGGVNLLVAKMDDQHDPIALVEITDGAIVGATKPQGLQAGWTVSSEAPEITREFTGQVIMPQDTLIQDDSALVLGQDESITVLISSTDEEGSVYPILARVNQGIGSVFVDAGQPMRSVEEVPFWRLYYWSPFSELVPLMVTMRYTLADEAWHHNPNYANLTIDDPALTEPWRQLSFYGLLGEMRDHNFHTTIAFIPVNWDTSEREVISLFRANPGRLSLVQHGNNHDGYEFYKYEVSAGDEQPARPFEEQEADLLEGMARMDLHVQHTGIPHDKVMVFPYGISPEATLVLLKQNNFLATVNGQDVPLDATRPSNWDYGMYPGQVNYGNFLTLPRQLADDYPPTQAMLQRLVFDLFLDKPAISYGHQGGLFEIGMHAFNPVADYLNNLHGELEWRSLGDVIKHLHLQKVNDDGSVDVMMLGRYLVLSNESGDERTYHMFKEEALNVPISYLTVNGHEFPYRVEEGVLALDVRVPAGSSLEIVIRYEEPAG